MNRALKILTVTVFSVVMLSLLSLVSFADDGNTFYTVTWKIGDETVRESYKAGEIPAFKSNVPDSSEKFDYYEDKNGALFQISGWDKTISAATSSVIYTATAEKCYFSFTDSSDKVTEYYTTRDLMGAFAKTKETAHIKLYDNVSLSRTSENKIKPPSVPEGKAVYFDLNGYYYSVSGFGAVNGDKIGNLATGNNSKLYVYSSRPGGAMYNSYKWWSASAVMGASLFSMASGAEVHVGKVTYDGVTYPGDNLSTYMGLMCYNYGTGALFIDGGTYNATYGDAGGIFIFEKETVINAKNATFTSKTASFFRQKEKEVRATADDPINANFENCVFKSSSSKTDAFISQEYSEYQFKMRFENCEFSITPNAEYGRWTYFGEGCLFPAGAKINGSRIDASLAQWKTNVSKTYNYKTNTFAFDDKTENGVRTSYIKASSFVLTEKNDVAEFGIYLFGNEIDTRAAVTVSEGFEYRFYLPESAYDSGAILTIDGVQTDYSSETEIIDGKLYYVLRLTAKDPINSVKTTKATLLRTRLNDKEYTDEWSLSVVGYMNDLLAEDEHSEIHRLAIDYLAYVSALCDYKGLVSQNVKTVINRYADKISPSVPADFGTASKDVDSISGFFHSIKLELSDSPKLIFLIKPNAVGTARLIYTDLSGEEKSVLLEKSLIKGTETVDGILYKRYELLIGVQGVNFEVTLKTYNSGNETGSVQYNLATYLAGVRSSNPTQYNYILINLLERLSAYSVSANAYIKSLK